MTAYPITLDTLGKLYAYKHGLWAFCETGTCNHNKELDIAALIACYGEESPFLGRTLAGKLICEACGQKQAGIRIMAPNGYDVWKRKKPAPA